MTCHGEVLLLSRLNSRSSLLCVCDDHQLTHARVQRRASLACVLAVQARDPARHVLPAIAGPQSPSSAVLSQR